MARIRREWQQHRGRRRLDGKEQNRIENGIDRLVQELGIPQVPCTPSVIESPPSELPAATYALAGMGVIFVIAVTNCPLM